MNRVEPGSAVGEDRLVAELETLGVRYLSRQTPARIQRARPPRELLTDLLYQPSSRVRHAVVAVLLAQPGFGHVAPALARALPPAEQNTFKLFYTAAVILQRLHAESLRAYLGDRWRWLDDWFSAELGIPAQAAPAEQLRCLGALHAQATGAHLNWAGTYANVAHHLLRRWELERLWDR